MKVLSLAATAMALCIAAASAQVRIPENLEPKYLYDTHGATLEEGSIVTVDGYKSLVLRSNVNQPGLVLMLEAVHPVNEDGKEIMYWQQKSGENRGFGYMALFSSPVFTKVGTNDEDCGLFNLFSLRRKIENTFGFTMSDFYAFNACSLMGGGWYLPAINELLLIPKALGVETATKKERKAAKKRFKEFRKEHDLKKGKCTYFNIYSSTEKSEDKVMILQEDLTPKDYDKKEWILVMPVHLIKAVESSSTKG